MKKRMTRMVMVLVATLMCLNMAVISYAANSTVTYVGGAEKFIFFPGSTYEKTDLFDGFKGVMPGDTLSESITVKNEYSGCDYVMIYLRAEEHEEIDEFADAADGEEGGASVTMRQFLNQLHMKVTQGETVLYEASPDELDGLKENVLLGAFSYGTSTNLNVELSIPIELGNEYANCVGGVNWVFTVEHRNNASDPTPVIKPSNNPDKSTETSDHIFDLDVKGEQGEDEAPFLAVLPRTGDDTLIWPYILLGVICILGIAFLISKKRK